jgi:ATP-dependent RNA helicase DeaD
VKDHIKRRNLKLEHIQYFVLDEADEMLNIGFREEIEEILAVTPKEKRVLLFSATMPKAILAIAEKYMHDYDFISIKKEDINSNLINQIYFEVREKDKLDALTRILDIEDDFFGIVFCRTKRDVDEVAEKLKLRGYLSDALHGDIDQRQREKILRRFKNGDINILVATDVAARGIDVNNLTHVINYNLPESPESYTHRIGRT